MSDARENKHSMAIDDSTTSLPLICQVNLAREFRGGERQTELLTRELSDEGWPQRLVIRTGNLLGKRLAGLPKLDIREVSSNPVAAALACRGTSLVHAHEARAVYSGWLASLLFKTPYIMTRRVVNPQKKSGIRESAYRRASATVAITEAAAETMRHQQSFVEPHIIPSSAAALEFDEATADDIRGRFEGKTLIGHIGTLDDSSKGQRTLFEVARRASTSHPDWQFIFVGDGRDQRAFEDETRDLNNVHFEGFADNVGDYLTAFDLFAFPSVQEAMGSTLLDAMQKGLPIVASRTGGIPEIIRDGHNGLLIEPRDAEAFYAAIEKVLGDESLRSRFSGNSLEESKKYAASTMAAAYRSIYQSVLNR